MASSSSGSSKKGHWLRNQRKEDDSDSEEESLADYARLHVEKVDEESDSEESKEIIPRATSARSSKRRHKDTPQERQRKVSFSYFIVSYGRLWLLK